MKTLQDTIRYVLARRRLTGGNISEAQTVIITITERPQGGDINLSAARQVTVSREAGKVLDR